MARFSRGRRSQVSLCQNRKGGDSCSLLILLGGELGFADCQNHMVLAQIAIRSRTELLVGGFVARGSKGS